MYKGQKILGVILARGGSKGIPRKNLQNLRGKPLLAWSIEAGQNSLLLDRLVLSSDDEELIRTAQHFNCEVPFVRPATLATDCISAVEPVLHAVKNLPGYDYVVLLQATSPLRTAEDIDGCIRQCIDNESPFCVSIMEPSKSPYWMYTLAEGRLLQPVIPVDDLPQNRQDLPNTFALNGAVYVAQCDCLKQHKKFITEQTIGYLMPTERSIDIDYQHDFYLAEAILEETSCPRTFGSRHCLDLKLGKDAA